VLVPWWFRFGPFFVDDELWNLTDATSSNDVWKLRYIVSSQNSRMNQSTTFKIIASGKLDTKRIIQGFLHPTGFSPAIVDLTKPHDDYSG
jgi:hypothetical protein